MKTISYVAIIGAISVTTACSSGSSGSDDDASAISISGSTALPEQMSLVTAQEEDDDSSSSSFVANQNAYMAKAIADTSSLPSSSDYVTAKQNVYVWLDAVEPISFIDSLLCFTNQSQPLVMKDQGNYISWNDASRCFEDKGGDGDGGGDGQGSGEQVQQFVTIVGNSSQASASAPLIYRGWVEDYSGQSGENGGPTGIKIRGEVRKTPTEDNPFGEFTLTYGLLPSINASQADNQGFGEVVSTESSNGGASFTLFQEDNFTENSTEIQCNTTASVDYNEATETGLARTGRECSEVGGSALPDYSGTFALAVNSDYVHMAKAASYSAINAGTFDGEMCLARDGFNSVVWNYTLYNKANGSAVAINSGMQLKLDGDGDGSGSDANGFEGWGHIGYWGSWREDGQRFTDGETVQEATYDDTVGDEFTVKVASGRLIKNTVDAIDLADLDGVTFSTWLFEGDTFLLTGATNFNGDADSTDGLEVILEANSTNNGFEVTGIRSFSEGGEQITPVSPAVAVPLNTDVVLNMWSRQLGGNVRYLSGATKIRFFTRSFVDGSETGSGELFAGGASVTLECFDRCLSTNISASLANNADQNAVFKGGSPQNLETYSFSSTDLTLKVGASPVAYASDVTKSDVENSQHWRWGLNSGPMISSTVATAQTIATRANLYAAIEAGDVTEFYVWETGLEPWQQQMVLIDGSNNVVSFDKPISIKYTHVTANDRNGSATQDGKVFLLEYGGKGQLWGLPFEENGNGRWGPVINLKDGTILGASDQYIIKANDVEQRMQTVASSNCSNLPLSAPSQSVPTGITGDVFGIGDMPDLSDEPPTVVDGEVVQ